MPPTNRRNVTFAQAVKNSNLPQPRVELDQSIEESGDEGTSPPVVVQSTSAEIHRAPEVDTTAEVQTVTEVVSVDIGNLDQVMEVDDVL